MSYKWDLMRQRWKVPSPDLRMIDGEHTITVPERDTSPLSTLPSEILNIIAQFLSVKDLLSCSTTCVRLRAVFNDNLIWRKFGKQNIIAYQKKARRKVKIDYDISSLVYNLDPLCDERINYIRQNQLLNNWKNGKFLEQEIHSSIGLYYMSLKSGTAIIYDDIYLFLYDFYAHNIMVWIIQGAPIPYTKIRLLYHNYFYEGLHYEVIGNKLVVLEVGKLIQIYNINLPQKMLPLACIILFDKEEPLNRIPEFNNPEDMYAVCNHKIIENKIYCHKIGKPILHIWDIEMGKKVRALEPPKSCSDLDVLSAINKGNDLILCLEINDAQRQYNALGTVYEVLSYSFSRDFFRSIWTNKEASSSVYIPFHAIQHEDIVILFCRLHNLFVEDSSLPKTVLVLYDYKWGMIIGEKSFPELVCHRQAKVVNGQLLLATSFCLYLLDLNTQDIIYSFKFDSGKIELLSVFDGNFVVTTPKSLMSVSKLRRKEVWDVKNRRRCIFVSYIFTSPHSKDSVFVNQSCTKMVIVGKGTMGVLNFW